jgi:hypothetical protein
LPDHCWICILRPGGLWGYHHKRYPRNYNHLPVNIKWGDLIRQWCGKCNDDVNRTGTPKGIAIASPTPSGAVCGVHADSNANSGSGTPLVYKHVYFIYIPSTRGLCILFSFLRDIQYSAPRTTSFCGQRLGMANFIACSPSVRGPWV